VADDFDAVVLAGGSARRLGGVDKAALEVGGRSLLDRVLDAVADASRVVVVGPVRTTDAPVVWCREEPAGGGPVAALAAGLAHVQADRVVVLAGDLPFLTADVVTQLRDAATGRDGALVVDPDGRDQLLLGMWDAAALRAALPAQPAGARLGETLGRLDPVRIRIDAEPAPWFDCDTEADLATARGTA
jgi:molybdopterin-guanine dinucleotide biosynthesis protein A